MSMQPSDLFLKIAKNESRGTPKTFLIGPEFEPNALLKTNIHKNAAWNEVATTVCYGTGIELLGRWNQITQPIYKNTLAFLRPLKGANVAKEFVPIRDAVNQFLATFKDDPFMVMSHVKLLSKGLIYSYLTPRVLRPRINRCTPSQTAAIQFENFGLWYDFFGGKIPSFYSPNSKTPKELVRTTRVDYFLGKTNTQFFSQQIAPGDRNESSNQDAETLVPQSMKDVTYWFGYDDEGQFRLTKFDDEGMKNEGLTGGRLLDVCSLRVQRLLSRTETFQDLTFAFRRCGRLAYIRSSSGPFHKEDSALPFEDSTHAQWLRNKR